MADSRSRILASIRQSLATAPLPLTLGDGRRTTEEAPPASVLRPSLLVEQFKAELEKLGGLFIEERADKVPARVAALIGERQPASVVGWGPEHLPLAGLLAELERAGIAVGQFHLPADPSPRRQGLAEIESATIGITGVDAALADTGTLVLRSGAGRPRLASLSVRTHIALFTVAQLHASWEAWWRTLPALAEWVVTASNVTFISGPSRTADIEMTLTVGVHGPAEVIAILIQT